MVRKVVIGVVSVVVVLVLAVAGFIWWSLRPGMPDLPPELEALYSEAEAVGEARPFSVAGGWSSVVSSVKTDSAVVRVWADDDMDEFAIAVLKVGTSEAVGSCTVAVLETHPGRAWRGLGSQTGWALLHLSCPPRPSATPSETATPGPSATPSVTPGATASAEGTQH
ncbi:hypothetical protein [Actinomyces trachealis]|uniref:hypothetical protein n=1 Tax=Actinomyces trachealis TaxID=2763540 RepID=UPI001892B061|nr:hypothetical protein [Actinomyces trachealis]